MRKGIMGILSLCLVICMLSAGCGAANAKDASSDQAAEQSAETGQEDTGEAEMTLDPVIEKVGAYFSKTSFAGWSGSATELKDEMKVDDVPVNTITKRLNANRHLLKRKYGIKYDFTRSGKSRMISLMRETDPGTDKASDSCDSL